MNYCGVRRARLDTVRQTKLGGNESAQQVEEKENQKGKGKRKLNGVGAKQNKFFYHEHKNMVNWLTALYFEYKKISAIIHKCLNIIMRQVQMLVY